MQSSEKIFTSGQAAKRLGIPLLTLRRLIRDGTLWPTLMEDGSVGLSESEIQRFFEKAGKLAKYIEQTQAPQR